MKRTSFFVLVVLAILVVSVSSFAQDHASPAKGSVVAPPSTQGLPGLKVRTPLYIFTPEGSIRPEIPSGETPSSIACIYGVTSYTPGCPKSGTLVASGGANAIAVVEYGYNSTLQGDFNTFNAQFGLPTQTLQFICACSSCPSSNRTGWDLETALDTQYAHAMAPNAQIIVAEFCDDPIGDGAETDAANAVAAAGGGEVSNSWTYDGGEGWCGSGNCELQYDSYFTTPGVVYFASAGDDGCQVNYPSVSPNVSSAGGTTIIRDSNGNFDGQENCWSGSGGGISQYEPAQQYQLLIGNITGPHRGIPDLAADADPNSGVDVYSSSYCGGWCVVGGTSVASPTLAGITNAAGNFRSATFLQLLKEYGWYNSPGLYHKYFYDETQGSNGGSCGGAKFGWDQCTGLGSPRNLAGF